MSKPKLTDSVKLGLRSIGIRQNRNISLDEALDKGWVAIKNNKYVMTSKGEKARVQSLKDI